MLAAFTLALACSPGRTHAARPTLASALFPLTPQFTFDLGAALEGDFGINDDALFVATREGSLRALERLTGSLLWKRTFPPGTTLATQGDVLVIRKPDGQVARLDPRDGHTLWNTPTSVVGALPPTLGSDRVLVAGAGLAALDTRDGRQVWGSTEGPALTHAPGVVDKRAFVLMPEGGLAARALDTGSLLWTWRGQAPLAAAPVADEQRVYLGTRERAFLGLRLTHGSTRWRWRLGADVLVPPALTARVVLVASEEGVLYALRPGSGHLVWRTPLPSRPLGAPLVVGDAVLVACREADLAGYALADGQALGSFRTPGELRGTPRVLGDWIYFATRFPWTLHGLRLDLTRKPVSAATATPKPSSRP